jgi:hypothetical protein
MERTGLMTLYFETQEDIKIFEMLHALSRHKHPRNMFQGQTPEAIALAILRDGVPYPYWQCVASTQRPGGAALE